jgi:NADH-quinone oxidoreductase subunit E
VTYPLAPPSQTIPAATRARLAELFARHTRPADALLTALYIVQEDCNYLSEPVLSELADLMAMPKSLMFEVTTFYALYSTVPQGRNIVMVCQNLCCFLRGADELIEAVCAELGIRPGETTPDGKFTLRPVECLAACERAPAIQINDRLVGPVTPADVRRLLAECR